MKKIVYISCLEVGYNILVHLVEQGVVIHTLITVSEREKDKYNISGYKDHSKFAKSKNINVYYPKRYDLKDEDDELFFKEQNFDFLIVGGWQRLIPLGLLKTLKDLGIGIHGSSEFLPYGRGRSPINWSLILDKKRFIIHIFKLEEGADNGMILDYDSFDINVWDDCNTLYLKNSIISKRLIHQVIKKYFKNEIVFRNQIGKEFYYRKRSQQDGMIDWTRDVFEIYNLIRAVTKPYPGAFSFINGTKVLLWKAQPFDTRITYFDSQIGEIVEVFDDKTFLVNCYSGLLLVTQFESENLEIKKGLMFLNNGE